MLATPLSMSIEAGVSASTSEMRPPLQASTWQNRRSVAESCCAELKKSPPLGSVEIFAATGLTEEGQAIVGLLVHRCLG